MSPVDKASALREGEVEVSRGQLEKAADVRPRAQRRTEYFAGHAFPAAAPGELRDSLVGGQPVYLALHPGVEPLQGLGVVPRLVA